MKHEIKNEFYWFPWSNNDKFRTDNAKIPDKRRKRLSKRPKATYFIFILFQNLNISHIFKKIAGFLSNGKFLITSKILRAPNLKKKIAT